MGLGHSALMGAPPQGGALGYSMPPLQGCLALKGRNELASSQRHSMGAIAPVESPSVAIDVVISVCLAQRAQSTRRNSSLPTSLSTSDFTLPTSFSVIAWARERTCNLRLYMRACAEA